MKKLFALLTFPLLISFSVLPIYAVTPACPATGAYADSRYEKNLRSLPEQTERDAVVAAALSQLFYHEGNGEGGFDGADSGGTGNYTEYNRTLGKIGGTYGYAWCASFASWCFFKAGEETAALGRFASCSLWVEALRKAGLYRTEKNGYVPLRGDLIFFRSDGCTRESDHVGLVRYIKDNRIYTVEGNTGNAVKLRDYALSDTRIIGYGVPAYSKNSMLSDNKLTGYYTVTSTKINLRAGPGASYPKLGTAAAGSTFRVIALENGYGQTGTGEYFCLNYAEKIMDLPASIMENPPANTPTREPDSPAGNDPVAGLPEEPAGRPPENPSPAGERSVRAEREAGSIYGVLSLSLCLFLICRKYRVFL